MRRSVAASALLALVAMIGCAGCAGREQVASEQHAQHDATSAPPAPAAQAPQPTVAQPLARPASTRGANGAKTVAEAFADHARDVAVEDRGVVIKLLRDDREGRRHQRFLVRVDDGTTVLIAHNIELAPRVEPLAFGDVVAFRGEYVWNAKGGVVHWTHDDPDGHHAGGWIEVGGRRFR